MLNTQNRLEIWRIMIIFDVGEIQNLKPTTSSGDKRMKKGLMHLVLFYYESLLYTIFIF